MGEWIWLILSQALQSIINLGTLTQCPGFPDQQLQGALCSPFASPGHPTPPQDTRGACVAFLLE